MIPSIGEYLNLHRGVWSAETLDRYSRALRALPGDVGPDWQAGDFCAWLWAHAWGSSATWVAFCAVRGYLAWRWPGHPALVLKIRRREAGPQRSLTGDQVGRLLASFDTSLVIGVRDLAICALMLDSGLRCSEVCRLQLRHLVVGELRLMVMVKGGRWADGVYSANTAQFLLDWLSVKPGNVETVFCSLGGLTPGASLSRSGLQLIVRRWGRRIGISLSPHDLRRTFAVLATRAGAPGRVLQVAGRWSSMAMVERYTRSITSQDFVGYFPVAKILGG